MLLFLPWNAAFSPAPSKPQPAAGIIYVDKYFQLGLEAIIPINRASGTSVGAVAQLHIYLDDIFPTTIGRPLFTSSATSGRPMSGN